MKNKHDSSSISFTAHYTGFVWFRHGLSQPAFATQQGRLYFSLLRPFEFIARHLIGSDIQTTLLQRHYLIDRELTALIATTPDVQILELACGLSPRGHRFTQQHSGITYVEADLSGMAARKKNLLAQINSLSAQHRVVECNILDLPEPRTKTAAENGTEHKTDSTADNISIEAVIAREFNPQKPLVIITEGLVNYFSLPTISRVWQRINAVLKNFPHGIYLTDIYPGVEGRRFSSTIRAANNGLRVVSRSGFTLHFANDTKMQAHFTAQGFAKVTVLNPDHETTADKNPLVSGAHSGAIVRVIKAEAV